MTAKTTETKVTADGLARMTVPVRDLAGRKTGEMVVGGLSSKVVSARLLAQIIHTNRDRQRIRRAHTKGRGEVRGGGKKPWRQKGTGRARHASRRSPLWVGGGVTGGPRAGQRVKKFVPKGMRQQAMAGVLAHHIRGGSFSVIRIEKSVPNKTKELAEQMGRRGRVLIITLSGEKAWRRAAGNLPQVQIAGADQVKLNSLIQAEQVWVLTEAIDGLVQRTGGKITLAKEESAPARKGDK